MNKPFELIVRFGDVREAEAPREAEIFVFATEAERDAYRDGIISSCPSDKRDFVNRNADGSIPGDTDWHDLFGYDEEDEEQP